MNQNNTSTILEVGVKAFIFNNDHQFLVLKRKQPYSGQKIIKWDIPGGRVKFREPILKALKEKLRKKQVCF